MLNIGHEPVAVDVAIRNFQGDEIAVDPASQICDEPVLPAHVCRGPGFGDQGRFYCAVRFVGNANSVRATLQLTNDSGVSLSAEAR